MEATQHMLTAEQMRLCDEAMHRGGVPSLVLMERAARAVVDARQHNRELFPQGAALVLCGNGDNGGDGMAVARMLLPDDATVGPRTRVLYLGRLTEKGEPDTARMSDGCVEQYTQALAAGVRVLTPDQIEEALKNVTVVIDAVFGIGLRRAVNQEVADIFRRIKAMALPVLAVDIPTGVAADSGAVLGEVLPAAVTVTMQARKPGLYIYPGAGVCGQVIVADLGIDLRPATDSTRTGGGGLGQTAHLMGHDLLPLAMPPRERRTHKGTYGRLGLLCGSYGMAGAAILSATAAMRSGVGLARVITPEDNRAILQCALPEAVLSLYDRDHPRPETLPGADMLDGMVLGCGLGTGAASATVLRAMLSMQRASGKPFPVVLDADALNLLAADPTLWETPLLADPDRMVVLTPHPAEMSRLRGTSVPDVLTDPLKAARALSMERGVIVVMKDAHTLVVTPDGQLWVCVDGNPGMATAGSGDVLAGVLGALLVQARERLTDRTTAGQMIAAAVLRHAMAGDAAARARGEYGMIASDIIGALTDVQ